MVATNTGKVVLEIPRDLNGTFDPVLIAKFQHRFTEFDTKIISMHARGMTIRQIQGHIEEIYGFEASPSLISAITDTVMQEVTAWQNRPLEPCYPVVFMDAIRVNIRSDGAITNKAAFAARTILPEGTRGVLGLWSRPMRGQILGKGAERSAQPRRSRHPDRRRGRPQGFPSGHRSGLPPNPGPDLYCPPAAPFHKPCQLQGPQGGRRGSEGGLYGR